MVSLGKQISSQSYFKRCDFIEEVHEGGMKVVESHTQAIVECLEVVFLDEYHVV